MRSEKWEARTRKREAVRGGDARKSPVASFQPLPPSRKQAIDPASSIRVTTPTDRLTAALSDRYRIERELGQGELAAKSRGSADVAEATVAIGPPTAVPWRSTPGALATICRAVASATSLSGDPENHDADSLSRLTAALADRYRIERELGQGGMATVYLAQDLKHDRQVAIKVLRPELAAVARRRPVSPGDPPHRPAPASPHPAALRLR